MCSFEETCADSEWSVRRTRDQLEMAGSSNFSAGAWRPALFVLVALVVLATAAEGTVINCKCTRKGGINLPANDFTNICCGNGPVTDPKLIKGEITLVCSSSDAGHFGDVSSKYGSCCESYGFFGVCDSH